MEQNILDIGQYSEIWQYFILNFWNFTVIIFYFTFFFPTFFCLLLLMLLFAMTLLQMEAN